MRKTSNWNGKTFRWRQKQLEAITAFYKGENLPVAARSPKKATSTRVRCESEAMAQIRLSAWMHEEGIWHYAIPNGADVAPHHRRSLLDQGMSPGIPDLVVPYARGGKFGLYVELKREDGGAGLSEKQRAWLDFLSAEGYLAIQCNGFNEAQARIKAYLGLG